MKLIFFFLFTLSLCVITVITTFSQSSNQEYWGSPVPYFTRSKGVLDKYRIDTIFDWELNIKGERFKYSKGFDEKGKKECMLTFKDQRMIFIIPAKNAENIKNLAKMGQRKEIQVLFEKIILQCFFLYDPTSPEKGGYVTIETYLEMVKKEEDKIKKGKQLANNNSQNLQRKNAISEFGLSLNLPGFLFEVYKIKNFKQAFYVSDRVPDSEIQLKIFNMEGGIAIPLVYKGISINTSNSSNLIKEFEVQLGTLVLTSQLTPKEKNTLQEAFIFSLTEEGLQRALAIALRDSATGVWLKFNIANERDILSYSFSRSSSTSSNTSSLTGAVGGGEYGGVLGLFPFLLGGQYGKIEGDIKGESNSKSSSSSYSEGGEYIRKEYTASVFIKFFK